MEADVISGLGNFWGVKEGVPRLYDSKFQFFKTNQNYLSKMSSYHVKGHGKNNVLVHSTASYIYKKFNKKILK